MMIACTTPSAGMGHLAFWFAARASRSAAALVDGLPGPRDLLHMAPSTPAPTSRTDMELVEACLAGDARAWRELVNRYRRLAWGVPRALGLQPADADEVFQTTFVELLKHLPRIERPERLEAWLVTTARRASLRLLRRERRRRRLADEAAREMPAGRPPESEALDRLREADRLLRLVEELGAPCDRLLLGLFAEPPRPYRVLARELGFAVGSLGSLRARCLSLLRRSIARAARPADPERRRRAGGRS